MSSQPHFNDHYKSLLDQLPPSMKKDVWLRLTTRKNKPLSEEQVRGIHSDIEELLTREVNRYFTAIFIIYGTLGKFDAEYLSATRLLGLSANRYFFKNINKHVIHVIADQVIITHYLIIYLLLFRNVNFACCITVLLFFNA